MSPGRSAADQSRTGGPRWSAEPIGDIKMTPWSTRERTETTVRFEDAPGGEAPVEVAAPAAPRKFRINASDLA